MLVCLYIPFWMYFISECEQTFRLSLTAKSRKNTQKTYLDTKIFLRFFGWILRLRELIFPIRAPQNGQIQYVWPFWFLFAVTEFRADAYPAIFRLLFLLVSIRWCPYIYHFGFILRQNVSKYSGVFWTWKSEKRRKKRYADAKIFWRFIIQILRLRE